MPRYRLFLSEHEVYDAIVQLESWCSSTGSLLVDPQTSVSATKSRIARPEGYSATLRVTDGTEVPLSIQAQTTDDRSFTGGDFVLVLETETDLPPVAALLETLRVTLATSIPRIIWTMEHFLGTLKAPMVTQVASLTENLILTAVSAAEAVQEGFVKREKVHYERPLVADGVSYLRVEVKEDVFEYISMNEFQIFQQGPVLVAVGITRQDGGLFNAPKSCLSLWFSTEHSELVNGRFGKNFEKALFSGLSVRGGKFTVDQ